MGNDSQDTPIEVPEDLQIKVGNPDMVYWQTIIDNTKLSITNLEKGMKFEKAVLAMASAHFKRAEAAFKK